MKKLLSATLAALLSLSLGVSAFAAAAPVEKKLTDLTSQPISEDGTIYAAGDSIAPNQTIYFLIPNSAAAQLNDAKITKMSVKKLKNSSLVKSTTLVEKKLTTSTGNYTVPVVKSNTAGTNTVPMNQRNTYLAVQLNDTTSTDEFKVELEISFTARKAGVNFTYGNTADANDNFLTNPLAVGDKVVFKTAFYVANKEDSGDSSITVGSKGVTVKPIKNELNEVLFENSSGDEIANLSFTATSSPEKFYASLTTKWTSDLLAKFKNTDAVIRRFTAATIDSTSRATLLLNNPFDADVVNPKSVYIYSVSSKGVLTDVTKSFIYDSDLDGFSTKTRTLGTWIISDTKIKLK